MAEQIPLLEPAVANEAHFREPFNGTSPIPDGVNQRKAAMDSIARTGEPPAFVRDDQELETLRSEMKDREDSKVRDRIDQSLSNPVTSLEQKSSEVRSLTPLLDREFTAQEAFVDAVSNRSESKGPDIAVEQAVREHTQELADFERQASLLPSLLDLDPVSSPSVFLGDLLELAVLPGTYAPPIVATIQHIFPEATEITDNILVGDAIEFFKKELASLPLEERLEKSKAAYEFINELEVLGVIDNDLVKVDVAHALFDSPYDADWERRLDNVVGLIDYAFFGTFLTSGIRGGKALFKTLNNKPWKAAEKMLKATARRTRINPSVAATLDEANPELSKRMTYMMLNDETGKLAGELGTTREEAVIELVLPKINDPIVRPAPDLNDDGFGLLAYSPDELETLINGVDSAVAKAADQRLTGVGLISKYNINLTPNGYVADIVIGGSDTRGFSSIRQAKAAAKGFKEYIEQARNTGFGEPVIMARNWKNGEFEDYIPLDEFRTSRREAARASRAEMEEKFLALADNQRGAPEAAMLKVQQTAGGGVLSPVVEHIGDLTHRMSEATALRQNFGYGPVKEKVNRILGYLQSPYGFVREMNENLAANARFFEKDAAQLDSDVKAALAKYADEHRKLEVHNDAQRIARDAAVAVGEQRWKDAENLLLQLQSHLGSSAEWKKFASQGMPSKQASTPGEYLIKFQMEERFTSRFAGAEGAVSGEGFSGRLAKFLDKDSWAKDWFTRAMVGASDKSSLRLRKLRDTIKPFTSLDVRDSRKVLEQAQFSADNEVWLTRQDLFREWAHESDASKVKLIQGYEALRRHQDLVREYINEGLYRILEGRGAKEVVLTGTDGTRITKIGSPISDLPTGVRKVYDPEGSVFREISRDEVDALREKGVQFVKFETPLRKDNVVANYGIIRGKNAKLNELPYELVPDTPGYFTRMYDAGYLVREIIDAEVDGVAQKTTRVVGIESDLGSADELLEQLNADALAAGKNTKYDRVRSKELEFQSLYYDPFNLEYLEDTGQLYTGHRGPERLGKRDKVTNKRRRVLQGLAHSIEASQIKASRIGAQDFIVDKLRTNWVKLYGEKFGINQIGSDGRVTGRTMPWTIDQIPSAKSPEDALMRKDAIAMMEQIKLAAGIDDSSTKRMIEEFMVNWSESVYRPGSKWRDVTSRAILKSRDIGIINKVKGLAFFQLITMKPLRQVVLQANQMSLYLGRDDAFTYFMGKGSREFATLLQGMVARHLDQYDSMAPALAKAAGMSTDDYKTFVQAYADSGLSQAIDSHLWTAPLDVQPSIAGVHMGTGGMMGEYVSRKAKLATKYVRRIGFDAGEQTQLMAAFLAEKNAWQVANPKIASQWYKPQYRDLIAAEARRLSLNMNSLGAMGFQNGVLSPMFQFMSHTTKTLQLMTPSQAFGKDIPLLSKFANNKIRDAEKYKMAISHALMYGTGGYWMMTEGYEALKRELGIENAGDIDMYVEEGITGTGLNLALRAVSGDDTINIEASKALSPLGGTSPVGNPLGKLLEYIMFQNQSLDNFAGPGWTTMKRMYKSVGVLNTIVHGVPELSVPEHFEAAAKEVLRGSLLSVDDWERARFEMQLGRYLSQNGNVGLTANSTEILTKSALSLRSRADNRLRTLKLDIQGLRADPLEDPDLGNKVREAAKRDADNLIRVFQLLQKGEMLEGDIERIVDGMAKKNQIVYGGPDGEDPALGFYKAHLTAHLVNWQIETTPGSNQYELGIIKAILSSFKEATRDEREEMFRRIEAAPDFEHKEALVEGLRDQWEMN